MALIGLSGAVKDPRSISDSPFPAPLAQRASEAPPTWGEIYHEYRRCTKRTTNASMIGFNDSPQDGCYHVAWCGLMARIYNDPPSMAEITRRRRQFADPDRPPWKPKPEYLQWLARQERLTPGKVPKAPAAEGLSSVPSAPWAYSNATTATLTQSPPSPPSTR